MPGVPGMRWGVRKSSSGGGGSSSGGGRRSSNSNRRQRAYSSYNNRNRKQKKEGGAGKAIARFGKEAARSIAMSVVTTQASKRINSALFNKFPMTKVKDAVKK